MPKDKDAPLATQVSVWLDETSEALKHEAKATYTKGPMYCVMADDGRVVKYPVCRVFRIVEETGVTVGPHAHENGVLSEVWLDETSVPMVSQARSCYTKGPLYCVMSVVGQGTRVVKYPLEHIFRAVEA